MKTSDVDILFVPGLEGASADHWQSRWASRLSTARVLETRDWKTLGRGQWINAILAAAQACERPAVLIGHAMGSHAIANAAPMLRPGSILGFMMVAPPDESAFGASPEFADWARGPPTPLPAAALLVASRNDPLAPFEASQAIARAWGAKLLDAGEAGQINAASGHGPWPEGLMSFAGFLRGL